jgi:hypothetical protein
VCVCVLGKVAMMVDGNGGGGGSDDDDDDDDDDDEELRVKSWRPIFGIDLLDDTGFWCLALRCCLGSGRCRVCSQQPNLTACSLQNESTLMVCRLCVNVILRQSLGLTHRPSGVYITFFFGFD